MMNWQEISKAPKDGTVVWLCWMADGVPMEVLRMHYDKLKVNPLVSDDAGMWSTIDGGCTWFDGGDDGPTHFSITG